MVLDLEVKVRSERRRISDDADLLALSNPVSHRDPFDSMCPYMVSIG